MRIQRRDLSRSGRLCLALTCFLTIALAPTAHAEIDRIEYWWDCDPAATFALDLRNAVAVACGTYDYYVEAPASPSFVGVQIPACVKAGHHVLTFRAGELGGGWGPVYAIPVLIPPPANLQIVAGEWFLSNPAFMQAPAEGTGYPLDAATIAASQDCASLLSDAGWLSIDIPAGTLPGSYAIGFRLQDSEGVWGPVRWESLLVEQADFPVTSVSLVDDAWIDDIIDPHWVCGNTAVPLQPDPANPGWYSADVLCSDFPTQEGYACISFQVGNQVFDVLRYVSLAPVVNASPVAAINANPLAGKAPLNVTFSGAGSTDDGTIVSYAWDFGDGAMAQGIQINHTYTAPGVYTAALTVTDDFCSTDTASVIITVSPDPAPVALISATPLSGKAPLDVTFDAAGSSDDGTIVSYAWNFGDGNAATGVNPVHTYVAQGNYTATLTVTDDFGSTGTASVTITVNAAGSTFRRGDPNSDGKVDIADAITTLGYLFGPEGDPSKAKVRDCFDAADANDDGKLDIADAIKVLGHLFASEGPLPDPFAECGLDPSVETPELTCQTFPPCP